MTTKDWPLVLFQILAQGGVGVFLVMGTLLTVSRIRREYEQEYRRLATIGFSVAVGLVGLALLISWFHVSQMMRVLSSTPNLDSSWLAWEVVFTIAFLLMAAAMVGLMLVRNISFGARMSWGVLTGAVGILAVIATAQVYMLNSRPAWDTPYTMTLFLTTTAMLGILASAVIAGGYHLSLGSKEPAFESLLSRDYSLMALSAVALLALQAVNLLAYVSYLNSGPQAAQDAYDILIKDYAGWFWLRVIGGIVAPLVLAAGIFSFGGKESAAHAPRFVPRIIGAGPGAMKALAEVPAHRGVMSIFLLVLMGELISRFLFFLAVVPVTP